MFFIQSLLLALPLISQSPPDVPNDETEFGYYYGEFLTYAMADDQPMAKLITDRLAESLFQASSSKELQDRLKLLKTSAREHPELLGRFVNLDTKMKRSFTGRVSKSKQKRLLYTVGGAVVGAIIGLPVGKLISAHTTLGIKVLWIAVPAGALLGAGAGFLLSQILDMPENIQSSDFLSKDLESIREEISH
ncbi:MAG: hypothetical protein JWQ35_1806 [Bacteriovoracaceae bacterium]|nr:hypothetical protein [Bacteriovoracaceae bacterium]